MKYLYLFLVSFSSLSVFSQAEHNVQLGLHGLADIPFKGQMPRMSTNYGGGISLAFKPVKAFPLFIEAKVGAGLYNNRTSEETFIFDDESQTVTDVTFSSSMQRYQLGVKYYYTSFYRPVRGYITPQLGINLMRSRIRIADPEDVDDCMPLENRISHKSHGFTYGFEAGVELDVVALIRADDYSQSRLYASLSFMNSFRKTDYINTRFMNENEHGIYDGLHGAHTDPDGRPLTTKFVNVSNNDLHEHKIAEIYSTYLRFFTINIGYVWYF